MAVALASIVSALAILADWVAGQLVLGTRIFRTLEELSEAGLSRKDTHDRMERLVQTRRASQSDSSVWGPNLAIVALSMDFAALGIWIHKPDMFPFFMRFNAPNVSREIPVWFVVVFLHVIMLFVSLVLKHKHTSMIWSGLLGKTWFTQNGWMVAANFIGFIALLGGIVVFTNAL